MKKDSSRKLTQKTLQTSPAPASTHNKESSKMAGGEHEDDLPISVRTLRNELQVHRDGMMKDIKSQIETMQEAIHKDMSSLREEAKTDIKTLRDELSQKIQGLYSTHTEAAKAQKEMETALSDASDRLVALEDSQGSLTKELKRLQEKCLDLENRSRRQNLRIIDIAEGAEAGNPSCFAAELLTEVLGEENFTSPLIIDRAHRTLAPKPRREERPRAMVIRLHYYSDREKILRLSRNKGCLQYKGSPVHIFPDMSPEVGRLRASFNPVKAKLRSAGVPYSLYYPASLIITVDGSRHTFDNPQEAEKFINNFSTAPGE